MNLSIKFHNNGWAEFTIGEHVIDVSAITGFSRTTKPIGLSLNEALQAIQANKKYTLFGWCEGTDLIIKLVPYKYGYTFSALIVDDEKPYKTISNIHSESIPKFEIQQMFQDLVDSIDMEEYQSYLQYDNYLEE